MCLIIMKCRGLKLHKLQDGLYRVVTRYLCAAFVIKSGRVVMCAPILRKRFNYWRKIAVRVENA